MTRTGVMVVGFVCLVAGTAAAQSTFERGWIDVNFGVARAGEQTPDTVVATVPQFAQTARYEVDYRFPTGAAFDFGGGFMFTPFNGVGVSFSGTAHEDTALLRANIPHPLFLNRFGSDEAETEGKLMRTEGAVNIQGMSVLPLRSDRVRVRVFGGPTFFRVNLDAISDIRYTQVFTLGGANTITITDYETTEVEQTGWGFHVGGDVSVFFTRVVGVGGFGRFSRGKITLDDANVLRDDPIELTTGGFQFGGGLRLKF